MPEQMNMFDTRRSHFANAADSPRLKKLLAVFEDGLGHTTMELSTKCQGCAIHSDIHELRQNGYNIEREYMGKNANGRQVNIYRLVK